MKCNICKRMMRESKKHGICGKCRNKTLNCLIKDGLISPEIFDTNKKGFPDDWNEIEKQNENKTMAKKKKRIKRTQKKIK